MQTKPDLTALRRAAKRASEAVAERDRLICAAREEGIPLRTIADAAALSHTAVAKIAAKY